MSRDAYTWARVDCAVLHDPRLIQLPATGFRLYFTAYLLAFEYRSEQLPHFIDTRSIATLAQLDARTATKMLQKCCDVGLLSMSADNRIIVVGASQNGDPRMKWDSPADGTSGGQTPDVSDTDRPRGEHRPKLPTERTESDTTGEASELSVLGTHAQPPNTGKEEKPLPVQSIVASVVKGIAADRDPERDDGPEREPTDEHLNKVRKHIARMPIGDLVRHLATGSPKGTITDTLNAALSVLPEPELREICVHVLAKTEANAWGPNKTAAVLTSRCKKRVESKT